MIATRNHYFFFCVFNIHQARGIIIYYLDVFYGLVCDINRFKWIYFIVIMIYNIDAIKLHAALIQHPGLICGILNELFFDFWRILHLIKFPNITLKAM